MDFIILTKENLLIAYEWRILLKNDMFDTDGFNVFFGTYGQFDNR